MNTFPDVTVIAPCYNAAEYLSDCLDSLKAQTIGLDHLQYIFIDDASTDATLDILKDFEASYPEQTLLISLEHNQGQGVARNLALTYAAGTYVLFVDADDTIADYALELLFKYAQSSDSDVIEFDFVRQKQAWISESEAGLILPSAYEVTDTMSRQIFCTSVPRFGFIWNKFYRREFLVDNHIQNAERLVHEDTLFSQLVSLNTVHYLYIPVPLYFYRLNPSGTMLQAQSNDLRQFDRLKVQWQFLEECDKRGFLEKYYLAIETMFLRTYYMDTILFIIERFTEAPMEQLQEMQFTVHTCFPDWQNNPFLFYQISSIEKLFLSTLNMKFNQESFQKLNFSLVIFSKIMDLSLIYEMLKY